MRTLADSVFYRYVKHFTPAGMAAAVNVDALDEPHTLCVGRTWLRREGVGQTSRYSHGGVSLDETVIPMVRLERITEILASVELTGVPRIVEVDEDRDDEVTLVVKNRGNVEVDFELSARSNLDEVLFDRRGTLKSGASCPLKFRIRGVYRSRPDGGTDASGTLSVIGMRLRHTDRGGKWREAVDGIVNLPVKVRPQKTKLETDALAGFDDV
jgi:hypothetical protein